MANIAVTVFTPTYNRAKTLNRLWESLKHQTCFQFEWLVVDDGSQDGTEHIVDEMRRNTQEFMIRYYKKDNGGKHRAINFGVKLAQGDLFFIVDSDDWLPMDAIENMVNVYDSIKKRNDFAGIAGCKYDENNQLMGTTFKGEYLDITSLEREAHHIRGEKAEAFKTDILRKYPFPCFEGENFISEGIVWNRIAFDGYKLRWFNKNVYYCEYQNDGITLRLREMYRKNPRGYLSYVASEIRYKKVKGIRKYNWYGRCIETTKECLTKEEIRRLLEIHPLQYGVAVAVFWMYAFMRK